MYKDTAICPDYDNLVAYFSGRSKNPEVKKHIEICNTCQLVKESWEDIHNILKMKSIEQELREKISYNNLPKSVRKIVSDYNKYANYYIRIRTRNNQVISIKNMENCNILEKAASYPSTKKTKSKHIYGVFQKDSLKPIGSFKIQTNKIDIKIY